MRLPLRNDKCPCNSGKKFKKCCIDTIYYSDTAFRTHVHKKLTRCRTLEGETRLERVYRKAFKLSVVEIRHSKDLFLADIKRDKIYNRLCRDANGKYIELNKDFYSCNPFFEYAMKLYNSNFGR